MTASYEPIASPRYRIEQGPDGEVIWIRAPRPIVATLFLALWLAGWTAAGAATAWAAVTYGAPATWIFFALWAVSWLGVVAVLTWVLVGCQTIRLVGADLEIADEALFLRRRWLYQGGQVRRLAVTPSLTWPSRRGVHTPFMSSGGGAVQFDYGARTIYAAPGLAEAEARQIVDYLKRRLPFAA